jgi:hypothetical protein
VVFVVNTKEQRNQGYGDEQCEAENLIVFFTMEMSLCFSKSLRATATIHMFGKTEIEYVSVQRDTDLLWAKDTPKWTS